jgi:hypothetical protein
MTYAVRLLTHKGRPTGYEVYNVQTRDAFFFYGVQPDEHALADALDRAQEHANKINQVESDSNG